MTTARLTKEAMAKKRQRGEPTGGTVPFGYNVVDGKLVENPEEQQTLDRIVELRGIGDSYPKIAQALNDDGAPSKTCGVWHPSTVQKVLSRKNTYQAIADTLNNEGIKTKTGKPWSFGKVANVLKGMI